MADIDLFTPATVEPAERTCVAVPATAKLSSYVPDTAKHISNAPAVSVVRVLHVINGEHYAGAERVQDLLALRLGECGYRVGFACVKPGCFAEMRQSQNAPLHCLPMRSKFDIGAARRIARLAKRDGYEIIHAHTARTAMVGVLAAKLAGVPFVYHVHSPTSRNTTRQWLNRINAAIERLSLIGADRLICVSQSLARHVESMGLARDKIAVVPNGVPAVESPRSWREPSAQWTLGTVALFRPRKGVEVLLEAMALLKREGRRVRLRAVGTFESPKYALDIAALSGELGVSDLIEWRGFARDVNGELLQFDLLVLPSLFGEGMPMVVLEAMAAGVPVVATDVEGIPEVVRDGREGLIVRPGDPRDLARAISEIISGRLDWSAMSAAARSRHAELFSDRAMASGVADVYEQLLRRLK
jgi:glycosyltransferase involved in cell wall biosynthesis